MKKNGGFFEFSQKELKTDGKTGEFPKKAACLFKVF